MSVYHQPIQPSSPLGDTISLHHLGMTYEARGVANPNTETLSSILSMFGHTPLRYPGGTPTETFFSLESPNTVRATHVSNPTQTTPFTPLSVFLETAHALNSPVVLVLPTWRYFSPEHAASGYLSAENATIIRTFLIDLFTGHYGPNNILALEIGNEWFQDAYLAGPNNPDGWTPAQFAQFQATYATLVAQTLNTLSLENSPAILVQTAQQGIQDVDTNGIPDTQEFADALSFAEYTSYGVVDHFYQPTREITPLDILLSNSFVASTRADRISNNGFDLDTMLLAATEWNIRAARNGDASGNDANITGFERLPLFLHLFADMLAAGVDLATVYTTQALGQDGMGTLSLANSTTLTPTGHLFALLYHTLPGTTLIDPNSDGTWSHEDALLTDNTNTPTLHHVAFAGLQTHVLYYTNLTEQAQNLILTPPPTTDATRGTLYVIEPTPGQNPLDALATAQTLTTPLSTLIDPTDPGTLTVLLPPYAVVAVVLPFEGTQTQGGALDDFLTTAWGHTTLYGQDGQDTLIGTTHQSLLYGGEGADQFLLDEGNHTVFGGSGNDTLFLQSDSSLTLDLRLSTTQSNRAHTLQINAIEHLHSGQANDHLTGNLSANQISGNAGNDTILGFEQADTLYGGSGNDALWGGNGHDTIDGGSGQDALYGEHGNDVLQGQQGNDSLFGGQSTDTLYGGEGFDTLNGESGRDVLYGGAWRDTLLGGSENDTLYGGDSHDVLYGGTQNDHLYGDAGNDRVHGESGHDRLYGGTGSDALFGGAGNDYLYGGNGQDRLDGGQGFDTLTGGKGADVFVIKSTSGHVTLTDFSLSEGDTLLLDPNLMNGTTSPETLLALCQLTTEGLYFQFSNTTSLLISTLNSSSALEAITIDWM